MPVRQEVSLLRINMRIAHVRENCITKRSSETMLRFWMSHRSRMCAWMVKVSGECCRDEMKSLSCTFVWFIARFSFHQQYAVFVCSKCVWKFLRCFMMFSPSLKSLLTCWVTMRIFLLWQSNQHFPRDFISTFRPKDNWNVGNVTGK